jgi:type II secretory pathway component PulM
MTSPPGPLSERLANIERQLDELRTFATQVNVTATGARAEVAEVAARVAEGCSCRCSCRS